MVTRNTFAITFIGILTTVCLMVFVIQVKAEPLDEQKQGLIGEWEGVWLGMDTPHTLIIHEIDTANAKARCTYIPPRGEKEPALADFIPGPNPKLLFKVKGNDYQFVLKDRVLEGTFQGIMATGHYVTNTCKMEKGTKK